MGLLKKFFNQTKKPEGILGKVMLMGMNGGGHAKLADYGMSYLPKHDVSQILELGCGGGRNINTLLKKYNSSFVTGIDYSEESVKKASKYNKKNKSRCMIKQGDVSTIILPKETMDIATAFETVYFWPNLEKCFKNVYDSLKDGGCFLIVNELDGEDEVGKSFESIIDGMKVYTSNELKEMLNSVGFTDVQAFHHKKNPWIAVLAKK